MKFANLHILYKNGKREVINCVSRATNLSYKMTKPVLYYETINDSWGKGKTLELEDVACWELNFKDYV